MPAKKIVRSKPARAAHPARKVAKPAPSTKPTAFGSPLGAGAAIAAIITIVVLAMLFEARNSSAPAYADAPSAVAADGPVPASSAAEPATPRATPPRPSAPATAATKAPEEPLRAATPAATPLVTIAGCVDREDRGFRLTNTTGDNAPKARSWKSGFLKKGAAPIALLDPANSVTLSDHVGERVSVTGTLSDREMRVHSLRRVASSCN